MIDVDRPLLVIVGGAAASGKTTLADRLARELRLPLLSRDEFKEALMDRLGAPDRARSRELGIASYGVISVMLNRLLTAGVGAVIESNFSRGIAEPDFRGPVARSRAVQLLCETSSAEIRRRYLARAAGGERHPGHHDADPETLADLAMSLAGDRHEPLDLDIPLLRIDTTGGYAPSFERILEFISDPDPRSVPARSGR